MELEEGYEVRAKHGPYQTRVREYKRRDLQPTETDQGLSRNRVAVFVP